MTLFRIIFDKNQSFSDLFEVYLGSWVGLALCDAVLVALFDHHKVNLVSCSIPWAHPGILSSWKMFKLGVGNVKLVFFAAVDESVAS